MHLSIIDHDKLMLVSFVYRFLNDYGELKIVIEDRQDVSRDLLICEYEKRQALISPSSVKSLLFEQMYLNYLIFLCDRFGDFAGLVYLVSFLNENDLPLAKKCKERLVVIDKVLDAVSDGNSRLPKKILLREPVDGEYSDLFSNKKFSQLVEWVESCLNNSSYLKALELSKRAFSIFDFNDFSLRNFPFLSAGLSFSKDVDLFVHNVGQLNRLGSMRAVSKYYLENVSSLDVDCYAQASKLLRIGYLYVISGCFSASHLIKLFEPLTLKYQDLTVDLTLLDCGEPETTNDPNGFDFDVSVISKPIKSSSAKKPKLAILISGQLRNYESAWSKLTDLSVDFEVDVFVATWSVCEWFPRDGDSARWIPAKYRQTIPARLLDFNFIKLNFPQTYQFLCREFTVEVDEEKITDFYSAKSVVLLDERKFENYFSNVSGLLHNGNLNQAKMFFGLYRVFQMVNQYGRNFYDGYVRLRPDKPLINISLDDINILGSSRSLLTEKFVDGVGDQFFIATYDAFERISSIWPQMRKHDGLDFMVGSNKRFAEHLILECCVKYSINTQIIRNSKSLPFQGVDFHFIGFVESLREDMRRAPVGKYSDISNFLDMVS